MNRGGSVFLDPVYEIWKIANVPVILERVKFS